jgi:hypothetical protein
VIDGASRSTYRTILRAVALLVTVFLLAGCAQLFLPRLDTIRELLFYDEFEYFHYDDHGSDGWETGSLEGEWMMRECYGYLLFHGPQQYIRTNERYGGPLQVEFYWSVVREGEADPVPTPEPVYNFTDFRFEFDRSGINVALKLFENGEDTLSIRDEQGNVIAGPVSVPSTGVAEGRLKIEYIPSGLGARVIASVSELDLEVGTEIDSTIGRTKMTIWVSGTWNNPRVAEAIYVYGE